MPYGEHYGTCPYCNAELVWLPFIQSPRSRHYKGCCVKDSNKKFNGKPLSYWKKRSQELVLYILVRGYLDYEGQNASIVQKMAADRLLVLAKRENPDLMRKLMKEASTCRNNLHKFLLGFYSVDRKRRTKKKE